MNIGEFKKFMESFTKILVSIRFYEALEKNVGAH